LQLERVIEITELKENFHTVFPKIAPRELGTLRNQHAIILFLTFVKILTRLIANYIHIQYPKIANKSQYSCLDIHQIHSFSLRTRISIT